MTRVLIVDDDSELCETLEAGLKKRAYDVAWAARADALWRKRLALLPEACVVSAPSPEAVLALPLESRR